MNKEELNKKIEELTTEIEAMITEHNDNLAKNEKLKVDINQAVGKQAAYREMLDS